MPRRLSLRQLEAFKAVMDLGTAARAADVLNISQPAMSKLLAHLEEDTGFQLFDRKGGRLLPTARARHLHAEINRVFLGVQQVERAVEVLRRQDQGHLVIGVLPALSGAVMQRVITRFRTLRPNVYLSIIACSSQSIAEQVRMRHIDVGLINFEIDDPDIAAEPIAPHPLVCILPPGHPLTQKDFLSPSNLLDVPMVAFERSGYTGRIIERALATLDCRPDIILEASTASLIGELVAAGTGVALFHPIHVYSVRHQVEVRHFYPEIPFNLVLCKRNDVRSSDLVNTFAQAMKSEIDDTIEEIKRSCRPQARGHVRVMTGSRANSSVRA